MLFLQEMAGILLGGFLMIARAITGEAVLVGRVLLLERARGCFPLGISRGVCPHMSQAGQEVQDEHLEHPSPRGRVWDGCWPG